MVGRRQVWQFAGTCAVLELGPQLQATTYGQKPTQPFYTWRREITGSKDHRSWDETLLNPPALLSGVTVVIVSPRKPVRGVGWARVSPSGCVGANATAMGSAQYGGDPSRAEMAPAQCCPS